MSFLQISPRFPPIWVGAFTVSKVLLTPAVQDGTKSPRNSISVSRPGDAQFPLALAMGVDLGPLLIPERCSAPPEEERFSA